MARIYEIKRIVVLIHETCLLDAIETSVYENFNIPNKNTFYKTWSS